MAAARRPAAVPGLHVELVVRSPDGERHDERRVVLMDWVRRTPTGRRNGRNGPACGPKVRRIVRGARPESLARLLAALAHPQRVTILLSLLGGKATHRLLAKATNLKAGPLYHHLRELRMAGLIGPKARDVYTLTPTGGRAILSALAMERLCRS